MKFLMTALLSLAATVSVHSSTAQADTLATAAVARSGSRVIINGGSYLRPNWRIGTVKDIFSDGRATVRIDGRFDDSVFSLQGAGVGVECLYNNQVCENHAIVYGERPGVIKEVFSNGFVSARLRGNFEETVLSLKDIGVQADCAVISCAIKLK